MNEHDEKTLDKVKVGDYVLIQKFKEYIAKVTHITKTQIHVNNMKFRKSDGYIIGGDRWNYCRISIPTSHDYHKIKRKLLINKISSISATDMMAVPTEQLEAALKLLLPTNEEPNE